MDVEKKKDLNRYRLSNIILLSLTASTWETLGETAFAFSGRMGKHVLDMMEKEQGLEIAGDDPAEVMREIGRLFVDEYGFCSNIDVEEEGDKYTVKVHNCINRGFTDQLVAEGVEKPFICPIMNACQAALRRMGYRMHESVTKWHDSNGSIITFESI